MLTKIRTLVFVLMLFMVTVTTVLAAKNYIDVSYGRFTATEEGLVLTTDSVPFGIVFNIDNGWVIHTDSMVQEPVGFIVTNDGDTIAVNSLSYNFENRKWIATVGPEDEERYFKRSARIVLPCGKLSINDDGDQLVIVTDGQDPSTTTIVYNHNTHQWMVNEVWPEF